MVYSRGSAGGGRYTQLHPFCGSDLGLATSFPRSQVPYHRHIPSALLSFPVLVPIPSQ